MLFRSTAGRTSAPAPASVRAKAVSAPTIESRSQALTQARLLQQQAPTLEHERRLAEAYAKAGIADAAYDHFEAALRLDPHDVPSLDGLARIWRDWGVADRALPFAYRAVFWAPDSAPAQNTLGTVLLALGLHDAARSRFERARQLDPAGAYAVNNLCDVALRQGRANEAVPLCAEAAALDGASHVVRNNLALALAAAGDLDAAVSAFERGASPAVAAYNQGIVLLASRQYDRAREAFTRARVADPSFLPALARLTRMAADAAAR